MSCICQDPEATQVTVNGIVYCETIDTVPPSCTPKSCPPNYELVDGECVRNFDTGQLCPEGYDYIYDEEQPSNSRCVFYEESLAACTCTADVIAQPQTICSGGVTSIALTSTLPGMVFSWTANPSGVTGATQGSGNTISQTLQTTGTAPGTVSYVITPYEPGNYGCAGTPITVLVTVNPLPIIGVTPVSPQSINSGDVVNIALSSPTTGTTFAWTVTAPSTITGAIAGSGTSISNTLTATADGVVIYNITATAPTGCTSTFNYTVNVTAPVAACLADFVIRVATETGCSSHGCNGGTFNVLASTVNLGRAYLSNTGGSEDVCGTNSIYPTVPCNGTGSGNGSLRSNTFVLTTAQAQAIAAQSVGGCIVFQLTCALNPNSVGYTGVLGACHTQAARVTITRNGVQIYDGCPAGNTFRIDPCTGIVCP